jgi:amidase
MERAARVAGVRFSARDFDAGTVGLGLLGKLFTAADAARASWTLQQASRRIGAFFEGFDALLTPTLSRPPPLVGALDPSPVEQALIRLLGRLDAAWVLGLLGIAGPIAARIFEFIPWTPVFNATGQPAMSVPLHWTPSGLPMGMHLVGRFGDEAALFRLAGQLEEARPWSGRTPPGAQGVFGPGAQAAGPASGIPA